jgi:hypothetical protein
MGMGTSAAVPQVSGPTFSGYTQPANWSDPAVSGRDLVVHRDVLRGVAARVAELAVQLEGVLSGWNGPAGQAGSPAAVGGWSEAQQLARAAANAHAGVGQFSNDLRQSHVDTATRITLSADHYDAAEQNITALANTATDPSATIVQSGGINTPVDPGYGQNWTPQQRQGYYMALRMERMNGGQNWTATFPITENANFAAASMPYTWQEVQALLRATNPDAVNAAGAAYGALYTALTEIATQLTHHGQTLAANWGGTTAVTAVSQVQQLYQTAADMQANSRAVQQSLGWYGPVLAAFKNSALSNTLQPATTHPAAVAAANTAAQQMMTALNGHVQTAYYLLPGAVNKNLPPAMAGNGGSGTSGGTRRGASGGGVAGGSAGAAGGPGGGVAGLPGGAGGPLPGSVGGGVPGVSTLGGGAPGVTVPGGAPGTAGQAPAPTQLAGVQPGGVGTISPGLPAPSVPGGGLGSVPPVVGGGGGGGGVLPPLPSTGRGGTTGRVGVSGEVPVPGGEPAPGELGGGIPGLGGSVPAGELAALGDTPTISPTGMITGQGLPAAADAVSADGLAASGGAAAGDAAAGPGGFPMMGGVSGGAGQGELGRARQSWVAEEEGTWGPDAAPGGAAAGADPAAEAGVGGMMPAGAGSGTGQQRDRTRQSWMAEEEDLWGGGQPAAPPVIGRECAQAG